MSDFEDSLSPQDPEIEYANQDRSVREGYYGTGDTTPPKDHVGVISLVLPKSVARFTVAARLRPCPHQEMFSPRGTSAKLHARQ